MVTCNAVSGDPPFSFQWLKDGRHLDHIKHVSVKVLDEFTSRLTISKLDSESIGNYSCRVSNSVGSDEKYDMFIIEGIYRFNVLLLPPFVVEFTKDKLLSIKWVKKRKILFIKFYVKERNYCYHIVYGNVMPSAERCVKSLISHLIFVFPKTK